MSYYYRTDITKDYWVVPYSIIEKVKDLLIVVDPLAKKMQTIKISELEDTIDDLFYRKVYIPVIPEIYSLSEYETKLLLRFHYSWFNECKDYLTSENFKKIISTSVSYRNKEEVFPSVTEIFSAFLSNFYNIKVVFLGLSPYFTKQDERMDANGIAFSSYNKQKPKSLQVLADGIKKDIGLGFGWVLQNDLLHLQNQGVLLLNSALTSTKDPLIHVELWKPFIQYVLDKLNVPTIAFGKVAQSFDFKDKRVWKVNHPAYYAYKEKEPDYKCFSELNEIINIEY